MFVSVHICVCVWVCFFVCVCVYVRMCVNMIVCVIIGHAIITIEIENFNLPADKCSVFFCTVLFYFAQFISSEAFFLSSISHNYAHDHDKIGQDRTERNPLPILSSFFHSLFFSSLFLSYYHSRLGNLIACLRSFLTVFHTYHSIHNSSIQLAFPLSFMYFFPAIAT